MKRVLAVVAVLVLVVVVVLVTRRRAPESSLAPAPDAAAPAAAAVVDEVRRDAPPVAEKRLAPAHRVLVPPPASPPPRAPKLVRGGELVDRREDPRSPNADEQREGIMAAMDAVEDDVEDCLEAWAQVDPSFLGRVALSFEVAPEGLGKVWITDHESVPEGPMTCFASAIYSIDWANLTDRPIELSNRFVVQDGEPAQVDVRGPAEPK